MQVRLDKFLADNEFGTRSQVKDIVKAGRVKLDGNTVKKSDIKFDPENVSVTVDGEEIEYERTRYFMMNKPAGVVCANEDGMHDTVFDLCDINGKSKLFCMGRLDIDTEGLLLITNDGALSHRLLSPKKHVEKKYYFEVDNNIPLEACDIIAAGYRVDDELLAKPGKLEILSDTKGFLSITEGKFHQVKRMLGFFGCKVIYLKRVSFGGVELDEDLKPGEFRSLTQEELNILKNR